MQFYFIRHGQSVNNALWDATGGNNGRKEDPELTEIGERQAQILADFLKQAESSNESGVIDNQNRFGFGITHIYTSLMVRAISTGARIAQALGLPLVGWTDWHEGGGIYLSDQETEEPIGQAGNDRSYFEANFPGLILPPELGSEGWWNRPFEERPQRIQRARRVFQELWRRHGKCEHRVAVISHGGFYNYFMATVFNQSRLDDHTSPERMGIPDLPAGRWMLMNNTAISRIDFAQGEIRLVYQNRVDFLPSDLIT